MGMRRGVILSIFTPNTSKFIAVGYGSHCQGKEATAIRLDDTILSFLMAMADINLNSK